jgi:hypothetical protein
VAIQGKVCEEQQVQKEPEKKLAKGAYDYRSKSFVISFRHSSDLIPALIAAQVIAGSR